MAKRQIIRYDDAEWDNGDYVLYFEEEEVERIYAEELVHDWMNKNKVTIYKAV
jgi:hypothetical protein